MAGFYGMALHGKWAALPWMLALHRTAQVNAKPLAPRFPLSTAWLDVFRHTDRHFQGIFAGNSYQLRRSDPNVSHKAGGIQIAPS